MKTVRVMFPGGFVCNAQDFQASNDNRLSLELKTNFKFSGVWLEHEMKPGEKVWQVQTLVWWKIAVSSVADGSLDMEPDNLGGGPKHQDYSSMAAFM